MIEFMLKNRRLRLYPDGTITCRAIIRGKETKNGAWHEIKFCEMNTGYLCCNLSVDGVQKLLLQHRLLHLARNPGWDIFDTSKNNCIDHKNHDTIDNTDGNLRVVTHQQNNFNRSNVKGYTWNKASKKWKAYIEVYGKQSHLGYFVKEEDARAAYLEAKARLHIIPP